MYGNEKLPGVSVSETYRAKGSIWQGAPESTWFKTVSVNGSGEEGTAISAGTIMKELTDGSYTPIAESDIVSAVAERIRARKLVLHQQLAKARKLLLKQPRQVFLLGCAEKSTRQSYMLATRLLRS